MEFLQPGTWADALAAKAEIPAALPIIGGTDVMVDLNFDRARPEHVLLAHAVVPQTRTLPGLQVLEGDNAVARYREVMGATNPADAADGTIRKLFAESVGENSVHGSDSADNAKLEIAQFFTDDEIVG